MSAEPRLCDYFTHDEMAALLRVASHNLLEVRRKSMKKGDFELDCALFSVDD